MVNYLLDDTLRALAQPHRRQIIDALGTGARTSSQLAETTGLRLNALAKHLDVLEQARIIESRKTGRVVTHTLRSEPLDELSGWLETRAIFWRNHFDDLADSLED